jgi:hypothetical protein
MPDTAMFGHRSQVVSTDKRRPRSHLGRSTRRYGSRIYLVHQVAARAKDFTCTLDGLLTEQGHVIVAEIYRHKCPPVAEGTARNAKIGPPSKEAPKHPQQSCELK